MNVTFTNWLTGQPSGKATENCAELYAHANYQWNDIKCDRTDRGRPLCQILV